MFSNTADVCIIAHNLVVTASVYGWRPHASMRKPSGNSRGYGSTTEHRTSLEGGSHATVSGSCELPTGPENVSVRRCSTRMVNLPCAVRWARDQHTRCGNIEREMGDLRSRHDLNQFASPVATSISLSMSPLPKQFRCRQTTDKNRRYLQHVECAEDVVGGAAL